MLVVEVVPVLVVVEVATVPLVVADTTPATTVALLLVLVVPLELVTVFYGMDEVVVEGAKRPIITLGGSGVFLARLLLLRLGREDGLRLVLGGGLGLGGHLLRLNLGVVVGEQMPFRSLGATVRHLEELDSGSELVVDAGLLMHAYIGDAHEKCRDDGRL